MKKKIFLVLMCTVALGSMAACNNNIEKEKIIVTTKEIQKSIVGNLPITFPLESSGKELNILISGTDNTSNNYVWKTYEKMTGVKTNFTGTTKDDRKQAVYSAISNKQNFDLFMKCKISSSTLNQYGKSGDILDLNKDDLLKRNAPNCWAYLRSHPEALASIANPDGSIYSLPQVNSGAELRVSRKVFINKKWLSKVNKRIPTTTQELYELLQKFKTCDANENGIADEIPLSSGDWASLQESFYGAFGLANRGVHNMYIDNDPLTNKERFIPGSDSYKAFLTYFNTLYQEGLLDNNIFTMSNGLFTSNIKLNKIGMFASTNLATIPAEHTDDWIAIEEAISGPNNDCLWTAIRANFHSVGAAVIPATCKNPELVLKWLDYFWTDEGTLFYHFGTENNTFVIKEDGSYDYTPEAYQKMKDGNITFDECISQISPYPGGNNPTVEVAPYFGGGETAKVPASAARKLFTYGPKEYWPVFTFTPSENDGIEEIEDDIKKCVQSYLISFINGAKSLDSWNEYLAQLDSFKVNNYLNFYEAAVTRYNILKNEK